MNRFGGVKIGLLFVIVVLAAAAYYGNEIGGVYWRKYRIGDAVARELANAGQITDAGIRQGILNEVDSMGLPREAGAHGNLGGVRPFANRTRGCANGRVELGGVWGRPP